MRRRHPIPRLWLMTDSRMGDGLWAALDRLPRGAGVVFRHYDLPDGKRRALLANVMRVARRRDLTVLAAGGLRGADGEHNRKPLRGLYSRSAHGRREIVGARQAGADLVFVSPAFATRSHPGAKALGVVRFGLMVRGAGVPIIALGGMNVRRSKALARLGIYGWAGIDAWLPAGHAGGRLGARASTSSARTGCRSAV